MTNDDKLAIGMSIVVGFLLAGLFYYEETGENPLDVAGDWLVELTTSEEQKLAQLQPLVAEQVRGVIAACREAGFDVYVGTTLRTPAQEKTVIDAGRSAIKAGSHSWHELGRAVDLYPKLPNGKPDYNGGNLDNFRTMHEIAVGYGFRSIAFNADGSKRLITNSKGKQIWDGSHIEWRDPYDSIAEAVAAEGPAYGIA